ncbi:MAG TPA: YbaK/EbsC family protein [Hyphomicrobiaceae bacterium]|nr:YbaK/EbsC family protein [Hyphomicrobiaceae bacterium]
MGIAITLQEYLEEQGVPYDEVVHNRTGCSSRTAEASHVPGECLAKGVVIRRKDGFLLAIVPASRQVRLDELGRWLDQAVGLATEDEVCTLFDDCAPGAVPPIGPAYGLKSVVDDSLEGRRDIFFEGGDHQTLVHVTGAEFHRLMQNVPHGSFCA